MSPTTVSRRRSSPPSRSETSGASSTPRRRRRARTCARDSRTCERSMPMTNTELPGLEDALRRGAAVDLDAAAEAATIAAIAAADRDGLVAVEVSTVESPVGDLLVAVTEG